jgi:hypothetical protein
MVLVLLTVLALSIAFEASHHGGIQKVFAAGAAHGVDLSWTASPSAATYALTGYYSVFRGVAAGGEGSTAYATGISPTATAWSDSAVTAGSTYFYTMEFCVPNGGSTVCSAPSNEASAQVPLVSGDLNPPGSVAAKGH